MNHNLSIATPLPRELPVLAVLGLKDPEAGDWARLRGLQYSSLIHASRLRIGAHLIAAAEVLWLYRTIIHPVALIGWLIALAGSLVYARSIDQGLADTDRRRISRAEVNRQTWCSAWIALVWVVPVAAFAPFGDLSTRLQLWAISTALLTASAVLLPAVPLGSLLLAGIVGGGAFAGFMIDHRWPMAVLALVNIGVIGCGSVGFARSFLTARIAEAGMAEKNEVVSLLLREFEEGEADWLWQTDTARRVRSVSPRFAFALGLPADEIDGKPFVELIAGPAWETGIFPSSLHDLAERIKRRESFSNVLVQVTIGGVPRWWELSGTPKLDENGTFDGFRGVGSDVTQQRESSEKIAHMARFDTLTGLPNRMMVTEALGEALRYGDKWRTRCAFLMIDLDRFKAVNDTLGHLVGDQLLARVSQRLKLILADNELCGRLGGDE